MSSTVQIEQRLMEAIRLLTPDEQEAMLYFAEFLQSCSSSNFLSRLDVELLTAVLKEKTPDGEVRLADRGITTEQAANLRSRLKPFAEDWNRAEMAVYDDL